MEETLQFFPFLLMMMWKIKCCALLETKINYEYRSNVHLLVYSLLYQSA